MNRKSIVACHLLVAGALPALADGAVDKIMTPADKERLAKYGTVRAEAIAEARAGGAPADLAVLDAILVAPQIPFAGLDMTGNWQCRTTKVGGLGALVVYGWFKCKVSDDGSGWLLEKTSGSQRTKGRFYDDTERRLIYLGSFFVSGEAPKPYGSGPESDQVGYAFRTAEGSWRIEMPSPYYESKLDIMEFRR
ncbi:MAG TPA: DUF4893 domain-containing protein [Rhizobiales bacterium]|nr:DUF4893 domain-containing protein [Hyphomicrobiales bacterium]